MIKQEVKSLTTTWLYHIYWSYDNDKTGSQMTYIYMALSYLLEL